MVCDSPKSLRINRRGTFFGDPFFRDAWADYNSAVRRIVDRFNHGWVSPSDRIRDSQYHSMYRTLRSAKQNYSSHSARFKEEDSCYKLVMDVHEFIGGDITVRTAGSTVSVRGKLEAANDGVACLRTEKGEESDDSSMSTRSSSTKTLHRRFTLPAEADLDRIESALSRDAVLTVTIPKKVDVRYIPVKIEGRSETGANSQGGIKRPNDSPLMSSRKKSLESRTSVPWRSNSMQREENKENGDLHENSIAARRSRFEKYQRNISKESPKVCPERTRDRVKYEEAKEIHIPIVIDDKEAKIFHPTEMRTNETENISDSKYTRNPLFDKHISQTNISSSSKPYDTKNQYTSKPPNYNINSPKNIPYSSTNISYSPKSTPYFPKSTPYSPKSTPYSPENTPYSQTPQKTENPLFLNKISNFNKGPDIDVKIINNINRNQTKNIDANANGSNVVKEINRTPLHDQSADFSEIKSTSERSKLLWAEKFKDKLKPSLNLLEDSDVSIDHNITVSSDSTNPRPKDSSTPEEVSNHYQAKKDKEKVDNSAEITKFPAKRNRSRDKETTERLYSKEQSFEDEDSLVKSPLKSAKLDRIPKFKLQSCHSLEGQSSQNNEKDLSDDNIHINKEDNLEIQKDTLETPQLESKTISPSVTPGSRNIPVEKRSSLMEDDIFKDCWNDFSNTLQDVLNRLQELSSELGQSRLLAHSTSCEDKLNEDKEKLSDGQSTPNDSNKKLDENMNNKNVNSVNTEIKEKNDKNGNKINENGNIGKSFKDKTNANKSKEKEDLHKYNGITYEVNGEFQQPKTVCEMNSNGANSGSVDSETDDDSDPDEEKHDSDSEKLDEDSNNQYCTPAASFVSDSESIAHSAISSQVENSSLSSNQLENSSILLDQAENASVSSNQDEASSTSSHLEVPSVIERNATNIETEHSSVVDVLQPQTSQRLGSLSTQSPTVHLSDKESNASSRTTSHLNSPLLSGSYEVLRIDDESDSLNNLNIFSNCASENFKPNIKQKSPETNISDSEDHETVEKPVNGNEEIVDVSTENSICSELAHIDDIGSDTDDVMGRERYQNAKPSRGKGSYQNAANSDLLRSKDRNRHKANFHNQDSNAKYSPDMGNFLSRGKETGKESPSHERPTIASAAKSRKDQPEPPNPPYVKQKAEPFKRFSGFSNVNSNNVRRMRDAWSNKKDNSSETSFDKGRSSPSPARDINNANHRYRSPSPLNSPKSPRERSFAKGLSTRYKEFFNDSDDGAMNYRDRKSKAYYSPTFSSNQKTQKNSNIRGDPVKKDKKFDSPLLSRKTEKKESEKYDKSEKFDKSDRFDSSEKLYKSDKSREPKSNTGYSYRDNKSDSRANPGPQSYTSGSHEPSYASTHQRLFRRFRNANLQPDSEAICFKEEEDRYKMVLDVEEYVPGEVEVLQDDKVLTVKGKVERKDGGGVSVRTFNRTFNIPKNCREEDIDSSLSEDGILTIFVPKKKERIIKIELVD